MNYSELQTAAFEYADCSADTSTTTQYDNFLRLVEARLNRTSFTREQEGESYTTLVGDTYTYALPTDFGRLRNIGTKVSLSDSSTTATFVPPEFYDTYVASNGEVPVYTTFGNNVKVWPVVDGYILEILYYKKIPALTAVAPSNWVSTNHPDLYLYGLLTEICAFRKDFETSKLWEEKLFGTLMILGDQNDKTKWSGPLFTTIAA